MDVYSLTYYWERNLIMEMTSSYEDTMALADKDSDPFMNKKVWVRAISMTSCVLSIIGSLFIIASFVCFKELRSLGRQILVNISAMDLGVAIANLVGAAVYFDGYYYFIGDRRSCTTKYTPIFSKPHYSERNDNISVMCPKSSAIEGLCISQAFFSVYFTYSSILWTISLSCYLYFRIVHYGTNFARYSLYFSYMFCYLLPLFLSVWLVMVDKLGYSPYESSGWCSIIMKDPADPTKRDIFVSIFGYNLWIILTFILVPLFSLCVHFYVRHEMKKPLTYQTSDRLTLALQSVDYKFLLIPVVFIVLRFWSFLGDVLNVFAVERNIPTWFSLTLITLAGIGDSGQGFTNGILFVLFTRKVRDKFIQLLTWLRTGEFCRSNHHQTHPDGSLNADERRYLLDRQKLESNAKPTLSYSSEHTPPIMD